MEPYAVVVMVILIGALILFVTEFIPIDLTALLIIGALVGTGALSPTEGVAGFANAATITVAAVLVLSAGLIRTGFVDWIGRRMSRAGGSSELRQLVVIILVVGTLSCFINNTAAVAMFLPVVSRIAREKGLSPSRLLIPLSFAGMFGGVCTYIGTSTNIVVGSIFLDAGHSPFGMFEFTGLGLVFFMIGLFYLALFGRRLLPDRRKEPSLTEEYHVNQFLTELVVEKDSPLIGKTLVESKLRETRNVEVLEILRKGEKLWVMLHDVRLQEGDILIVKARVENLLQIRESQGLSILPVVKLGDRDLQSEEVAFAEAVISPTSRLIGMTLKEVGFRTRYQTIALAIRRHGEEIREKIGRVRLQFGDTLLLLGSKVRLQSLRSNHDFLLIMEHAGAPAVRKRRILVALIIFVAVVMTASLRIFPIMTAAILGALAMILMGCLTIQEAYEAIEWRILALIAGTLSLGMAMEKTGLAAWIAGNFVEFAGFLGPFAVLSGLYLLTSLMTEVMSNNASAALLTPIAISIAGTMGVDPRPFAFCIAFAASASFMSPIGYQTNTMVYGPGGYKFTDYVKVGGLLNLMNWVTASVLIPIFWPFRS